MKPALPLFAGTFLYSDAMSEPQRVTPFFFLSLTLCIQFITICYWFHIQISNWISTHPPPHQLDCHYAIANQHHLLLRPLISGSDFSFPVLSLSNTFSLWQPRMLFENADLIMSLPCLKLSDALFNLHNFTMKSTCFFFVFFRWIK